MEDFANEKNKLNQQRSMKTCCNANFLFLKQPDSCSTFCLPKGDGFLIGHNLDEGTVDPVPGAIYINKRNEKKVGISFSEMQNKVANLETNFTWVSKFGSITFNVEGKDFIDGGYNEKGLYIQEMTLVDGQMSEKSVDGTPCIHMEMWMQYVLDNCTTVQEVIECLSSVSMDGWSWHFFVCDAQGMRAAIDFEKGLPVIHKDDDMPYSLMTNYFYAKEITNIRQYQGFGGNKVIDLTDMGGRDLEFDTRFVHACSMIENPPDQIDVDFAFQVLYAMDRSSISPSGGGRHWSYVIDTKENKVYIETRAAPKRKYVNLSSLKFSNEGPSQILDLHLKKIGDVTNNFQPLTIEGNQERFELSLSWLSDVEKLNDQNSIDETQELEEPTFNISQQRNNFLKYYDYLFSLQEKH